MMNQAKFVVDIEACVGCGKYVKVCPGGILRLNPSQRLRLRISKNLGGTVVGNGAFAFAVCPMGAISIFGLRRKTASPWSIVPLRHLQWIPLMPIGVPAADTRTKKC